MAECGYCKDCKYFEEKSPMSELDGLCLLASKPYPSEASKAISWGWGYDVERSGLDVAADFGCVEFAAREVTHE